MTANKILEEEYRKLVLSNQEHLMRKVDTIQETINDQREKCANRFARNETDIGKLQVKAGIWGVVGGLVGAGVLALRSFFSGK